MRLTRDSRACRNRWLTACPLWILRTSCLGAARRAVQPALPLCASLLPGNGLSGLTGRHSARNRIGPCGCNEGFSRPDWRQHPASMWSFEGGGLRQVDPHIHPPCLVRCSISCRGRSCFLVQEACCWRLGFTHGAYFGCRRRAAQLGFLGDLRQKRCSRYSMNTLES